MRQEPIDAEFVVITPAEPEEPPLRWWQGWYFDWRLGLIGGAVGGLTALLSVLR